jgi:hypothetical protein
VLKCRTCWKGTGKVRGSGREDEIYRGRTPYSQRCCLRIEKDKESMSGFVSEICGANKNGIIKIL